MTRTRGIVLSLLLLATFVTIYVASPVTTSFDSKWSVHTALSLAEGKGGDLREYLPIVEARKFQTIVKFGERYYTLFPVGMSLLGAGRGVFAWFDPEFKQRIIHSIPDRFEKTFASVYGAVAALLFFWMIYSRFPSVPARSRPLSFCARDIDVVYGVPRTLAARTADVMLVAAMLLLLRARQRPRSIHMRVSRWRSAFIIRPTAASRSGA